MSTLFSSVAVTRAWNLPVLFYYYVQSRMTHNICPFYFPSFLSYHFSLSSPALQPFSHTLRLPDHTAPIFLICMNLTFGGQNSRHSSKRMISSGSVHLSIKESVSCFQSQGWHIVITFQFESIWAEGTHTRLNGILSSFPTLVKLRSMKKAMGRLLEIGFFARSWVGEQDVMVSPMREGCLCASFRRRLLEVLGSWLRMRWWLASRNRGFDIRQTWNCIGRRRRILGSWRLLPSRPPSGWLAYGDRFCARNSWELRARNSIGRAFPRRPPPSFALCSICRSPRIRSRSRLRGGIQLGRHSVLYR